MSDPPGIGDKNSRHHFGIRYRAANTREFNSLLDSLERIGRLRQKAAFLAKNLVCFYETNSSMCPVFSYLPFHERSS